MKYTTLTKESFYDIVEKESPMAMKRFKDYIDDYKTSVDWDKIFNGNINYWEKTSFGDTLRTLIAPKFHNIPFALQKGVIFNFFRDNNIQIFTTEHPFNPLAWTFSTIDTTNGNIWTQYKNERHKEPEEYLIAELAEVAGIQMAFTLLNNSYLQNLN